MWEGEGVKGERASVCIPQFVLMVTTSAVPVPSLTTRRRRQRPIKAACTWEQEGARSLHRGYGRTDGPNSLRVRESERGESAISISLAAAPRALQSLNGGGTTSASARAARVVSHSCGWTCGDHWLCRGVSSNKDSHVRKCVLFFPLRACHASAAVCQKTMGEP